MFWFLVSAVILTVWLIDRASLKRKNTEQYNRGWWEGYGYLKDKIRALSKVDAAKVEAIHLETEGTAAQAESLEVTTDLAADDPGAIYRQSAEVAEQPVYEQAYEQPQPTLTPEAIAAKREQRTLQNLNTLLYLGSFLIVAAAAVFVTLTMPAAVKLTSLVVVTMAFYIAGLLLHAKSTRLKPAALAFVGTGLAILPFVGFALTSLGGFSGQSAWFITSIVGLAAYATAAVRLQSQLVSYLTMAFVLSLALSAVATLGLSILWYFIATIGVSVLCNSLHYIRPTLLPQLFWQPIEQTGVLTTPVALLASLLMMGTINISMYEVLFGLATAHYLVVWLQKRHIAYEIIVRVLLHTTLFIVACDVAKTETDQGVVALMLAWIGLAAAQVAYSLLRVRLTDGTSKITEISIISVMLTLITTALPVWLFTEHPAGWMTATVALIGAIALATAWRLRQVPWAYGTLLATLVLPFMLARWVVEPAIPYEVIAVVFAAVGAVVLAVLDQSKAVKQHAGIYSLLTAGLFTYIAALVMSGVLEERNSTTLWASLVAAALVILSSYVLRVALLEIIGAVLGIVAVAMATDLLHIAHEWRAVATVVVSTMVIAAGAAAHHIYGQRQRRDGLAILATVVYMGLIAAFQAENSVVSATAELLLLSGGVVALVMRAMRIHSKGVLSVLALCTYIIYPILGLLLALNSEGGWLALALAVVTATLWIGSYIEKSPAVLVAGHVAFYLLLHALWSWLQFNEDWRLLGTSWLAAGAAYLFYWYSHGRADAMRQLLSFITLQVLLAVAVLAYLFSADRTFIMAAAGSLLIMAATLALHGYLQRNKVYIEVALYAGTLGLQRIAAELLPELNIVVYAHWWALTLVLVALWRKQLHARLIVGLSFITASTGWYALMGTEGYSLLFLIEHLAVAIAGAVLRKQWAMWWGVIAVVVAILYFLRNFTALALLFLGFLLILFVIWRLLKIGKKK